MAITFRGQASGLNKETKSRNQAGFQEKSAAGDRQGVGGEDVSLKQAMSSFNKRNTSPVKKIGPQGLGVKGNNGYSIGSPAKISKNFYGGEAYFQDGYSGNLGSPAKKTCLPITARAKNSPLKMNQALVDGAANTNKEFVDVGSIVGGALNQPDKSAKGKTADLAPEKTKEKQEALDVPKAKKIDTNLGATNPMDDMEAPTLEF
tara:strand:+ start:497 stop:1108 length:612 start_codon:yes stop_codon:yes gene_type:complete